MIAFPLAQVKNHHSNGMWGGTSQKDLRHSWVGQVQGKSQKDLHHLGTCNIQGQLTRYHHSASVFHFAYLQTTSKHL